MEILNDIRRETSRTFSKKEGVPEKIMSKQAVRIKISGTYTEA
jgi:hypothetical protein